jgi:hypothetical protein
LLPHCQPPSSITTVKGRHQIPPPPPMPHSSLSSHLYMIGADRGDRQSGRKDSVAESHGQ